MPQPVLRLDRKESAAAQLAQQGDVIPAVNGLQPDVGHEERHGAEVAAIRGYCLAIRSALTDDGRPPLAAFGLKPALPP